MTVPHPNAVGSLGLAAEAWLLKERGITLRWWQRLAMRRQLEVDANGELVWRTIIESTPRRSGKSVRLREMALWRLHQAGAIGEEQLIMLTAKDLPIAREIMRRSWPWAIGRDYQTRKANGQEEVEHPDGSRWIVRSQESVYGYDTCLALVDEAWGIPPAIVDDGLEPSLLERRQPQLLLTSTAHRKATPLMRVRRAAALEQLTAPDDTLLLHWGADADAQPMDRAAWRQASPHWTPDRELMLERVLHRMMSGQADPDPDEPDPIEAFRSQFLNIWPAAKRAGDKQWLSRDVVASRGCRSVVFTSPVVAAIEVSVDGQQWSAAASDGQQTALIVGRPLPEVLAWVAGQCPAEVLAHQAVAHQLPDSFQIKPVTIGEATAACSTLANAARIGSIRWDSADAVAVQMANVVTVPGPGGPRFADKLSRGPIEAVKAMSWAHWRAVHHAPEAAAVF
jgi:hypothetical protein